VKRDALEAEESADKMEAEPRSPPGTAASSPIPMPSPNLSSAETSGGTNSPSNAAKRPGLSKIQAAREKKRLLQEKLRRNAAAMREAAAPPASGSQQKVDEKLSEVFTPSERKEPHVDVAIVKELEVKLAAAEERVRDMERRSKSAVNSFKHQVEERDLQVKALEEAIQVEKTKRSELEMEVRALSNQAEKKDMDSEVKTRAANAKLERTIEKLQSEVEELNEMVETLSLDKEQLELDKDLAEEKATELELELEKQKLDLEEAQLKQGAVASAATEGGADDLAQENAKLREALKRLHTASTAEKSELAREIKNLTKEREILQNDAAEFDDLQKTKSVLLAEVEELKNMLDTAQAYESMVEALSEKNLELADQNAELREANDELEELRLLSEEMEQQTLDFQQHLERDLESKNTEAINLQIRVEALQNKLQQRGSTEEELKTALIESRRTEETLREDVEEMKSVQMELQQARASAREANLALLSETDSQLRAGINAVLARSSSKQTALRASCTLELVPEAVLNQAREVFNLFSNCIELQDMSKLLVSHVFASGSSDQLQDLVMALLENSSIEFSLWQVISAKNLSFDQLGELAARVTPLLRQMCSGAQQLTRLIQDGGDGVVGMVNSVDQVQATVSVFEASSSTLRRIILKQGILQDVVRSPYATARTALLVEKQSEGSKNKGLENLLMEICEKLEETDDIGLNTENHEINLGSEDAAKHFLNSVASCPRAVPPCWKEFAVHVNDMMTEAKSTSGEVEKLKGALKRRVLELHEKSNEVSALQTLKRELEGKLHLARESLKSHDDLRKRCSELERALESKEIEIEQTLSVARAEVKKSIEEHRGEETKKAVSTPKSTPRNRSPTAAQESLQDVTDALVVRQLRDEIAFWRCRAMRKGSAEVKQVRFNPRKAFSGGDLAVNKFQSGERAMNRNERRTLLREALLTQARVRLPDASKRPEISLHQQRLAQRIEATRIATKLRDIALERTERETIAGLQTLGRLRFPAFESFPGTPATSLILSNKDASMLLNLPFHLMYN